ncbi:hypothetical protein D3C84_741140 [compost metagenome]
MHADHAIRTVHRRRNLGHAEGRRIGGNNGVFRQQRRRLTDHRFLYRQLLGDRLHQPVGPHRGFAQITAGLQIGQGALGFFFADLAQTHTIGKDLFDACPGVRQRGGIGIDQQRIETRACERMCNAGAHQTRTDHDYFFFIGVHVWLSIRRGSFY